MIVFSKCFECKHYQSSSDSNLKPFCKAFPDGITKEIFISDKSEPCSGKCSFEPEEKEGN